MKNKILKREKKIKMELKFKYFLHVFLKEAHDLINGWIADKIRLDIEDDMYNYVNVSEMHTFQENEKELSRLKAELFRGDDELRTDPDFDILAIKGVDYDKYDEEYLTKDIMNRIMKKQIVDPKKLLAGESNTHGRTTKVVDTKLKIELRHQAVKENREKRRRELEAKRREMMEKKEIELKAKMMIQKEEQEKKMRAEIEMQLIEQEAQRLRFEMAEKRKREEDMRKKWETSLIST